MCTHRSLAAIRSEHGILCVIELLLYFQRLLYQQRPRQKLKPLLYVRMLLEFVRRKSGFVAKSFYT